MTPDRTRHNRRDAKPFFSEHAQHAGSFPPEQHMEPIYWLMAANVAVWCGLGAYLLFLGQRQRRLAARLIHLESLRHDD